MDPPITKSSPSPWPHLPSDILTTIATLLGPTIGTLRLRSICHPWRTSLSPSSPASPLSLPSPLSSASPPLTLSQHSLYLLNNTSLLKLHHHPTTTLLSPLSSHPTTPASPLNLLTHGVTFISHSYTIYGSDNPFKKVAVSTAFSDDVDFVVLGLTHTGSLLVWRYGDEGWTRVSSGNRVFDDIVCFKGKFFATADRKGRLVMIDQRLRVVDMVFKLVYGCGRCTHLVGCGDSLYLVDRVERIGKGVEFGVFKLDEKGRFWEYEYDLSDGVLFLGGHVNFSLSRRDYGGSVRNVIFFQGEGEGEDDGDMLYDSDEDGEDTQVFDMKTCVASSLEEGEECFKLYWPPRSWFGEGAFRSR